MSSGPPAPVLGPEVPATIPSSTAEQLSAMPDAALPRQPAQAAEHNSAAVVEGGICPPESSAVEAVEGEESNRQKSSDGDRDSNAAQGEAAEQLHGGEQAGAAVETEAAAAPSEQPPLPVGPETAPDAEAAPPDQISASSPPAAGVVPPQPQPAQLPAKPEVTAMVETIVAPVEEALKQKPAADHVSQPPAPAASGIPPNVVSPKPAPRQRHKRAAATAAAKNLQSMIADEGMPASGSAEGPPAKRARGGSRKRKTPDAGQPAAGKPSNSMLNADHSAGKAGLASLLSSKNIGSRNGTSLTDLLWQPAKTSPSATTSTPGLNYFTQHPTNGLAALAMAQPAQASKPSSPTAASPTGEATAAAPAPAAEAQPSSAAEAGGVVTAGPSKPRKGRSSALQLAGLSKMDTAGPRSRAGGASKRGNAKKAKPAVAEAVVAAAPEAVAVVEKPKTRSRTTAGVAPGTRGRGRGGNRGRGKGRGSRGARSRAVREDTPLSEPEISGQSSETDYRGEREIDEPCDDLYGCASCHWLPQGCPGCQGSPQMQRPKSVRWQPEGGRYQKGIPEAPTFYPTEEEFADPLTYINKIRAEGEKCGIACIVPPKGWAPPFALDKGTNGQAAESFRFSIRKQPTWQLSMRQANAQKSGRKSAAGRSDAKLPDNEDESHVDSSDPGDIDGEFGFVTLDRTHTMTSFEAYAKWAKALHFGLPQEQAGESKEGATASSAGKPPPSVEEIEAEFWRIVETPDNVVESLYGQDLDSGHHGSGFPLPPSRRRLLVEHLRNTGPAARARGEGHTEGCACDCCKEPEEINYTPEEAAYSEHCWNINNLPRCKGSVLRYVIGEELITGVMVPWLYVGSCMSAFCWHIEDHALYSINYLHKGAPKVWYGVPAHASDALDTAMRDALPHLFEAAPDLLYQLVTMLSPTQLQQRNVPVHRLVHREGSFVITFPNAYHSGFNTGFNCAEAVNFAPPDWLPWGCSILNKYRRDGKAATLSNDALLIALVKGAEAVQRRADKEQAEAAVPDEGAAAHESAAAVDASVPPRDQDGDTDMSVEERAASGEKASTSGRAAVPGQRADTSYLDPIKVEDAPPEAIRLAAAELALRVQEERRRRTAGLGDNPEELTHQRMTGKPGNVDSCGLHTNTEDMDCMECKCDLWMTCITSAACPDKLFCPEHASHLNVPRQQWIVLYRYTLEELDEMLEVAQRCVSGTREAIAAASQRRLQKSDIEVKKLGPISKLIPQVGMHSPSPPPRRARGRPPAKRASPGVPEVKKEEAKEVEVKQEAAVPSEATKPAGAVKAAEAAQPAEGATPVEEGKTGDGAAKLAADAGIALGSPVPGAKRPCDKQEEGDWVPPKKIGRGPGRKKILKDADGSPAMSTPEEEEDESSPEESPPDKRDKADMDDYSPNDPSSARKGRGRSRGGGRGRGRGTARGRGRGRGRGRSATRRVSDSTTPPSSANEPSPAPTTGKPGVPDTVLGQVMGMTGAQMMGQAPGQLSPASMWGEMQRVMFPPNLAFSSGFGQELGLQGASLEQLSCIPGVWEPQQGLPAGMWSAVGAGVPTSAGAAAPSSPSPGAAGQKQGAAGNSVLMDILRASVQPQPQGGHIAQGSVPLAQAGTAQGPTAAAASQTEGQTPPAEQPTAASSAGAVEASGQAPVQEAVQPSQIRAEPLQAAAPMEHDDEETEQSEDESEDERRPFAGFFRPAAVAPREQQAQQAAAPAPAVPEGVGAGGARNSVVQGGSNASVEVPNQQATAAQNPQGVVEAPSNPTVERRVQTVTAGLTEY